MFAVMTMKSWHSFSLICGLVACISGNPIPGAHTVLGSTNLQQRNKTLCHHYISQLLWTTVWFNLVFMQVNSTAQKSASQCMERSETSALLKIKFISISNVYK